MITPRFFYPGGQMVRVSSHYSITGSFPFVDVHIDKDNALFLDPSAIRNGSGPHAKKAQTQLESFFKEVVSAARSSSPAKLSKGRSLLRHLHEPNETRLGLSQVGSRGRAFADKLATQFWDELRVNPACQHSVLTRLEDTRLFLDMVGDDRISDMTTRIIFDVLADFTDDMMRTYPNLRNSSSTVETTVWNSAKLDWNEAKFTLPKCFGKQLLLVPRDWVYWRTLMSPVPFYNRYATEVIHEEHSVILSNGRRSGPSKKTIKDQNPEIRKTNNDKAVEYKTRHGRDLVGEYRSWVDQNFEPLNDNEIHRRTP
ncbi:hypothetical protein [Rhodococcus sp. SJ-3]|uniref:hypothetical protein n=1 Tax=Rhodococcus sp. SJ-3 TaxID=3454628 RepID=UPI003F7AEB04